MEAKDKNSQIKRRLPEVTFIVIAAISLFLLLALITYHSSDPGWSRTGSNAQVANLGGFAGAWLADVLFCMFGYMAYIFPLLLVYAAWSPNLKLSYGMLIRTIAFILILAMGSGLASTYLTSSYLPAESGGIVGQGISNHMIDIFNMFGAGLIMLAVFLASITLFSGFSWLKVIDVLGRGTLIILAFLGRLLKRLIQRKPKAKPIIKIEKPKSVITKPETQIIPQPTTYNTSKPPLELLNLPDNTENQGYTREQLETMSKEVELRLQEFGVEAKVVAVHPGPVITRFELELAAGTKANKITVIAKDLARSLSVTSVRVVEVIAGKSVVGLELPNEKREVVCLREILASKQYRNAHSPLALALGKDISGNPVIVDLAKMPHLLVAGTTGSGKSVGLNAILLSLLYKYSPKQVRLIMIDPKMLELSVYEGIPHLLTPVVTDMKEAAHALRWCVAEMERRYKLMASLGVRNLIGYNNKIQDAKKKGAPLLGQEEELCELPSIVVLADEFADLIMVVGKKIEELIARIAQKARAAGIHLILATQRPSVDVITGLIKANIPSRIAFQVSSRVDSRTILDQMGAEQLLGYGDMLYLPPGTVIPVRVHGAFVEDEEVHRVVKFLKEQGQPEYNNEILEGSKENIPGIDPASNFGDAEQDPLYDQAIEFIVQARKVSISSIQRRFKIGYNRAARIVEAMEIAGVVSEMEANGNREVLVPKHE